MGPPRRRGRAPAQPSPGARPPAGTSARGGRGAGPAERDAGLLSATPVPLCSPPVCAGGRPASQVDRERERGHWQARVVTRLAAGRKGQAT